MSHLYVFQADDGPVKIGISENPQKRARELELSAGRAITRRFISPCINNPRAIEQALHKHFRAYRTVGEWFAVNFDEAESAARALLAPLMLADGPRSGDVARAAELAGRYRMMKESGFCSPEHLAGFCGSMTDDDFLALAVTMRALALQICDAFGVVADAVGPGPTLEQIKDRFEHSMLPQLAAEAARLTRIGTVSES